LSRGDFRVRCGCSWCILFALQETPERTIRE
jgi:hypothetical protein